MGTKISEFTAAAAIDGTETLALVQGGENVRATVDAVRGAGGRLLARGLVNGATGAVTLSAGVASVSRTGTGTYTITLSTAPTDAILVCGPGAAGVVHQDGAFAGAAVNAVALDMAGAAADVSFVFAVLGD
jgi:hypothetical protein